MKNIAVVGNIDHGKTTLVSAISRVFDGEKREFRKDPYTVLKTEAEIEFDGEKYLFFDYSEYEEYEKNLDGTENGAVLVCAATEGPLYGTETAVELCKELGIEIIAVFMNSCDCVDDEDLIDLVEMDVQDLLSERGIDEDIPFIRGSARNEIMDYSGWKGGVKKLVETVSEAL